MINLVVLPIIVPLLIGAILLLVRNNLRLQRIGGLLGAGGSVIVSLFLLQKVYIDGIQVVTLGSWAAPFGISLVSDLLSILLVTTSSLLTLIILWYSMHSLGEKRELSFFYPATLFMLTGINGAFTTGDIFNLFVFFEVFLMASYVLIALGGERIQLRESMKYIIVNIVAAALFVITIGYIYSVAGTLNMADLSVKLGEIGSMGVISTIAIMFLVVFGIKAGIFPLHFWLPGAYYAPPLPILALFGALLTKVGIYSITRVYTLIFTTDVAFTHDILMMLSIVTILLGSIGALAYMDVKKIIIYNIVIAVGVILFGVSAFNTFAVTGSVLYLIHDMLIKALLFLMIGVLILITGKTNLREMGGLIRQYPLLGWTYLVAVFALAGIPPLSGFAGKILIIQGGLEGGFVWQSIIVAMSTMVVLLSAIRIFIYAFWGTEKSFDGPPKKTYTNYMAPVMVLFVLTVSYGVFIEFLTPFFIEAGLQLMDPSFYVNAVLGGDR
ncbi:Na+/H+ antiporter subunit D [Chryseomicrobium palamuruense]|uniref:Na+/H+ antiporter subunit D n=1 Tax=Chryseomicrobium palamuruense TaxID=682973 RepID=A0ABV8UUQ5_9BACL